MLIITVTSSPYLQFFWLYPFTLVYLFFWVHTTMRSQLIYDWQAASHKSVVTRMLYFAGVLAPASQTGHLLNQMSRQTCYLIHSRACSTQIKSRILFHSLGSFLQHHSLAGSPWKLLLGTSEVLPFSNVSLTLWGQRVFLEQPRKAK